MRDHTEENVVAGLLHLIPWIGQRFILPRIRTSSEGVLAFLAPQLTEENTPLSTLVLQVQRYNSSALTSTNLVLRKFLNEFQNQIQVTLGLPQPGFNTPCLGSRVSSSRS